MRTCKIAYIFIGICLVALFGCQKDPYPYITKDEAKKIDSLVHPGIGNVAFIYNHNVYYVADFTKPVVQVTTDGSAVKDIRISHDHTKFAYLDAANQIRIVDGKGSLLKTLSDYSNVEAFDWSHDDKTLYIVHGDDIDYYGPPMDLPGISYGSFSGLSDQEVISASVSAGGDLAYVVHGFDFFDGDKYELIIEPANKGKAIEYTNPDKTQFRMHYVNFSSNEQDILVGYIDGNGSGESLVSVDFLTGLNPYPIGGYDNLLTATPVYNSKLNYLVAAKTTDSGQPVPAAIYLGTPPVFVDANVPHTMLLDKYGFSGVLYIDWK